MPALKAKRLKGLRMNEVSGVDAPAHLSPGYLVMKALAGGDPLADLADEQIEELTKALMADEQGEHVTTELIESLTKAMDDMPDAAKAQAAGLIAALGGDAGKTGDNPVAKAVAEALTKANTERDEAIAAKTAAEEALAKAKGPAPAETEEEALAKALATMPEPLRKAWAANDAIVQKAKADAEDAVKKAEVEREARLSSEYLAKAKGGDYAGLPSSPETLATILREVDEKLSKEAGAEALRILKAASNLTAGGAGDFRTYGGMGGDATAGAGALSQLEKAADELQAKDNDLDRPTALMKAADMNPELARAYQEGQG